MKKCKIFLRGFFVWIGVLGVLWLFLIASAMIPNELIKNNLMKSTYIIAGEELFEYYEGNKLNGIVDNYADSIWLNVAWYMGKDTPISASIDTKYYDGETNEEKEGLFLAVTEEDRMANADYTRYWHGTVGIIRILHLVTHVNGIRMLGFLITLFFAAIVMLLLIRDGKDMVAVSFFISLCLVKIWNIRFCMEYQPAFVIGFLMCILYLLLEKKGDEYLFLLAVAGGTAVAFFDFLTTETVTILMPLILVITVRGMENRMGNFKKSVRFVFTQGMAWGCAYGMTFWAKWLLATVITGENKFNLALSWAGERIAGDNAGTGKLSPILQKLVAPFANFSVLFGANKRLSGIHITLGIILIILFGVIVILCLKYSENDNKSVTLILALLGSLILLRFLVLNNHSYLHAFFTYRALMSFFMAMFCIIIVNTNKIMQKRNAGAAS